jgi:hypothetical protein
MNIKLLITAILLIFVNSSIKTSKNDTSLIENDNIQRPLTKEAFTEIKEVINKVIEFVELNEKSSNEEIKETNLRNHTDSFICKSCLYTFDKFHNFLKKKYGFIILEEFLATLCSLNLKHYICEKIIKLYAPTVVDSLVDHYFNPEYICTNRLICKFNHFIKLNPDDYARELLKDKPKQLNDNDKSNKQNKLTPDSSSHIWKVLHVTDIHTDLEYSEVN